ncbi:thioredoxin-disulfide reductase [Olsenella phocaeensis]|uniref:thioredoxin-disulfide reductase n=1 Tax=Olsenella phocaeensis TaxID=1852385 RepID=UPI003A919CF0
MSQKQQKDLVIVGAGPAGLSAAIYSARALLDAVTLEQEAVGGQIILTSEVDNYPGVPHTDGFTLTDTMQRQAEELGASVVMGKVESISKDERTGRFAVVTSDVSYESRAVIIAGGATPRPGGFEGEDEFRGHGVSYCATCDGMFYRGKQVFVIGGGNSAAEEALFLAKFADHVTMVVRKDHLRAQAAVQRQVEQNERVSVRFNTSIVKVDGDKLLKSVSLRDNLTGDVHVEEFDEGSFGVFVFVGRIPASELVSQSVDVDERGYIVTNERMETSLPGLFAAGDVRQTPLRQIITAASDGAVAATSVASYLGQPIDC